jgi:Zn-dependent protease with chaperone function
MALKASGGDMLRKYLPILMLALAAVPGCSARKPGDPLKPGFNLFSKEQDIELGRELAAQVRQQMPVVQNRELQNYIANVGQRLARQPEAGDYPYSFTMIQDPSVNAFALPGGPTFINTGLLKAAENEAQLAGVIAHEISHVALRHGTNQASKANLIQLPAMIAGGIAGGGTLGQLAQLGIGLGANSVLLKYSRDAESQADALGARLMAEAGWNPIEMARFFEKLAAEGGSRGPQFLSSHPDPGNRMRDVEAEIRTLPRGQFALGRTGEFDRAKQLVGSLPASNRQSADRSMAPSGPPTISTGGGMREVRGRNFSMAYPDSWQTFGDPNGASLTIAPQNGLVQSGGNTQIGYGVIVSYFFPESSRNLRDATNELIHHLHASNPNMQVSGRARSVRVDGQNGTMTMLTSGSPFGGGEVDALLTVSRPEGLFYMIFIAPERDFSQLQSMFDQMVRSIRFTS